MERITRFDKRITFKPNERMYERINKLFMNSSQYKTMSELIRHVMETGLDVLERDECRMEYNRGIEK